MKIYKLIELSDKDPNGEYTFEPSKDGGLYIKYSRFRQPNEKKQLNPSSGFKGIAHVIKGEFNVTTDNDEFPVSTGESFELDGSIEIWGENISNGESILLLTCGKDSKEVLDKTNET